MNRRIRALHSLTQANLGHHLYYQGNYPTLPFETKMTDEIDQLLIAALMEDSRLSLKALAQVSGLSVNSPFFF